MPKIQRITVAVLTEGGEAYELATNLRDQQTYSDMRRRNKWDAPEADQPQFARGLAYAAMRRLGHFVGTYDQFLDDMAAIDIVADLDEDGEPISTYVDPSTPTT